MLCSKDCKNAAFYEAISYRIKSKTSLCVPCHEKILLVAFCFVGNIFTRRDDKNCLFGHDLHSMTSSKNSDYESCKLWCADNTTCGAFTGKDDKCFFKGFGCKDAAYPDSLTYIYLKQMA